MMTTIINSKKLISAKFFLTAAAVSFLGIMLLTNSEASGVSVSHSLDICGKTLIPSLFPFMFLSAFITNSGILQRDFTLTDKFTYKIFALPGRSAAVFLMSIIGGYPIGAMMTEKLYSSKALTVNQANRMMLFCINPSPAFAINAIGFSMFSSRKTGVIIFVSTVLSNIILALFSRCLDDKKRISVNIHQDISPGTAITKAADTATWGIIKICAYVILFSVLLSLITSLTQSTGINDFLYGITEVTLGCERLSRLNNLPLISGIVAWGGLAVHFQVFSSIKETCTDLRLFFTSRILSGALSVIICDLLLKRFPVDISAVNQSSTVTLAANEASFPVSIALLITCFLFLLGDYTINNRIRNINHKHNSVETSEKV